MLAEAVVAALVAAVVLWLVLQPILRPSPRTFEQSIEPLDPEETPRGVALTALKEIEFDRETGKLSDADYQLLKAKYTGAALEAMRQESEQQPPAESGDVEALIAARMRTLRSASAPASPDSPAFSSHSSPSCPTCGPRPEADAVFCSSCGRRLTAQQSCDRCGAALQLGSRFCERCGRQVAA